MSPNRDVHPVQTEDRERCIGTLFIFLSTLMFAVSNVAVRYLTDHDLCIYWMLFYKESIGLLILLPWILFRFIQGRYRYTPVSLILFVCLAGIVCQMIGSPLHLFGLAVIGLIITVPLIQSATILSVAVIGYLVFGSVISLRRKISIAFLILAVIILSAGKELSAIGTPQCDTSVSTGLFLLGAVGAVIAGIAYAVYVTMIRYAVRQHWNDDNSIRLLFKVWHWIGHDCSKSRTAKENAPQKSSNGDTQAESEKYAESEKKQTDTPYYAPFPITLIIAIVFAVGILIFGIVLYGKHGVEGFYNVPDLAWTYICISGVCNLAGFFFQVLGLRMTSAIQASLIAVFQIVILSLIGVLFFHEMVNTIVIIGLGLAVCGVLMSAKPEKTKKQ